MKEFDIPKQSRTGESLRKHSSGLADFLKYNNAVPVIFGALFLFTGGAFAATNPEVQQAVLSTTETVQKVDNTFITAVNLETFPISVEIKDVSEDNDYYYVVYTFRTIDVVEYTWQEVARENTMRVEKSGLKGDLGTYLQEELGELRDNERARLVEAQQAEMRKGVSQKVVATVYAGLIGKFLSPTEETFPGYTPTVATVQDTDPNRLTNPAASPTFDGNAVTVPSSPGQGGDSEAPVITVFGNNPARITVGAHYSDLGAIALDNVDQNVGVYAEIDGVRMSTPAIDTSEAKTVVIVYRAVDQAGNAGVAERTVVIEPSPLQKAEPAPPEITDTSGTTTESSN